MKAYKLVKRRKDRAGEKLYSYSQPEYMGGIVYVHGVEAIPKPGNGALACFGSAREALDFAVNDHYLTNWPTDEALASLEVCGVEVWECEVVPAVLPRLWAWCDSVKRVCHWEPANTIYAASVTLEHKVWPTTNEEELNGRD